MKYVENTSELLKVIKAYSDCAYLLKIKCVCGDSSAWIPYAIPEVSEKEVIIGDKHYPLALLESVQIRYRGQYTGYKHTDSFKIKAEALLPLFAEEVRDDLLKFLNML